MVEPLATILFNSFLSSRPTHSTLHSVRNMVRPIRVPFPADFFTPRARRDKGKEKACELPDECGVCSPSHLSAGAHERPCSTRHSLWCSNLNSLTEVPPFRDPSARRHPSHHLPHTIHRSPPQRRVSTRTLHATQKRHSSYISELPPSSSVSRHAKDIARSQFIMAKNVASEHFHLEKAWAAYNSLVDSQAQASVMDKDLFAFYDKMVTTAEGMYEANGDLDALHTWGHRLRDLLQSLEHRTTPDSSYGYYHCLLARANALAGDLQQAISIARSMGGSLDKRASAIRAYESIIRSTRRHYDATRVLDFLIMEWDSIGAHLTRRSAGWYKPPIARQALSFRRTAYAILESIVSPSSVFAERRNWDKERRQRMGELLVEVLCDKHLPHEAYSVLQEMKKQDLPVRVSLHLSLVTLFARTDAFEIANRLFADVPDVGSNFKGYMSTGLVLFAYQGNIARAEEYFSQLAEKDDWISATDIAMLMHAHAVSGNTERVVALFHESFPRSPSGGTFAPSIVHYTVVIYAHAQRSDFDGMNEWLEAMSKAGFHPDAYVYNIVLKSFAMRGEVDSVGAILDQMRAAGMEPDRIGYTTVITLLAHRHDPVAAEAIYQRAIQEGIVPDRQMITSLMNAHVEAGSWKGVIRVFDYLKSAPARDIRLSIEVYNTLLKAYVLIGAPFRVVARLFSKLEEADVRPDAYTFALLIQSACDAGLMDVALDIFAEMDKLMTYWGSNFQINVYVLTIIVAGFLRTGDKVKAKAVYDDMRERGIQPTAVTFGTILAAYGKEKTEESFQIAEGFLKGLMDVKPRERVWIQPTDGRESALESVFRPLMQVYAQQQRPDDVERLFQNMLDAGGEPSLGLLTTLLDAYRRTGNIDSAMQVWPQIYQLGLRFSQVDSLFKGSEAVSHIDDNESNSSRHGLQRQANILCVPLSIYIDALSAAGYHLKIAATWKKLQRAGFTFNSHNWNHLAVALVRAGEPERAFELVEKVILPYQRRGDQTLMARDDPPDTPLMFDGRPPPASAPHSEALHTTDNRVLAVETTTRRASRLFDADEERENDFAHPLHILHQISPSWNNWRPHGATLRVLLMVLTRLESGVTIPPLQPGMDLNMAEGDPKLRRANANLARNILGRIYDDYPNTVRVLQKYEIDEKRRLGSAFGRVYNWT